MREEVRFQDNISNLRLVSFELSEAYRFTRWLKVGLGYRNIQKYYPEEKVFDTEKKTMLNIYFFHHRRDAKFTFTYRQRLQYEYDHIFSSDSGSVQKWYSRNKFLVRYDSLKNFTPYIAVELRWQIDNAKESDVDHKWHRARWEAGCYYTIGHISSVGLYGLYQHEWNMPAERRSTYFTIGFTFYSKFTRRKWRKEEMRFEFPDEGPE